MSTHPATINPRYSGSHPCPLCGRNSYWTCLSVQPQIVIRVECDGDCGSFETTYAEMKKLPHFGKPPHERPYAD